MKEEINKENEVIEKKTFFNKEVGLIILFVIITLIGVFFVSTYIRWNSEINQLNEILYYGQEDIKIEYLEDFYGNEIDPIIDDNQAFKMYCSSEYGSRCVTGDYVSNLENLFRNPINIVNIIILIDIILGYLLIKKRDIDNIKIYIVSSIILLYGVYSLGFQIFKIADYIKSVNNSEYLSNATIIRGLVTDSENKFIPVIQYEIDGNTYITYLDYEYKGSISESIGKDITVYYNKKDELDIEVKRSLLKHIIPIIVSILTIVSSVYYYKLRKKDKYAIQDERS